MRFQRQRLAIARAMVLRPRFVGMLSQILRFNRLATALAEAGDEASMTEPIADFLKAIDQYARDANTAGSAVVEIQNTMLFATVGQRGE